MLMSGGKTSRVVRTGAWAEAAQDSSPSATRESAPVPKKGVWNPTPCAREQIVDQQEGSRHLFWAKPYRMMDRPLLKPTYFFGVGGAAPPLLAAFSRSSCSIRNCSSRVSRFMGGACGAGWLGAIGGGAAATLGAMGTSMRSSLPPTLWTIGSPFCMTTTWQKIFLCWPGGLVASMVSLK